MNAVPTEPTKLSLRAPADVLAAIPFVVGYHPTDSVVVLAMHGKRLVFAAREDLPTDDDTEDEIGARRAALVAIVQRQHPTAVMVVGFGSAERVDAIAPDLRSAFELAGVAVLEVLRAADGRYWSYLCANPRCCPPEGSPYEFDTSPVAAQWTLAGRVALPDRAAYEAQLRPVDGPARLAMAGATERADARLFEIIALGCAEESAEEVVGTALLIAGREALAVALWRLRTGGRLDDDEVAWLSVLVASVPVRDELWGQITGSPEELELHQALWQDVLRRAAPDLVPAPASLFAFAAWRCGQGVLARLALERALDEDPGYTMAQLLLHALEHGLPPSAFDEFPDHPIRRVRARRPRKRSSNRRARSRRE